MKAYQRLIAVVTFGAAFSVAATAQTANNDTSQTATGATNVEPTKDLPASSTLGGVEFGISADYYFFEGKWNNFKGISEFWSSPNQNGVSTPYVFLTEPKAKGDFVGATISLGYQQWDIDIAFRQGSDTLTGIAEFNPNVYTNDLYDNHIKDDNTIEDLRVRYNIGAIKGFYIAGGLLYEQTNETYTFSTDPSNTVVAPYSSTIYTDKSLPLSYATLGLGYGKIMPLGGDWFLAGKAELVGMYVIKSSGARIMGIPQVTTTTVTATTGTTTSAASGPAEIGGRGTGTVELRNVLNESSAISLEVGGEYWNASGERITLKQVEGGFVRLLYQHKW
jgi:hypothetical protein